MNALQLSDTSEAKAVPFFHSDLSALNEQRQTSTEIVWHEVPYGSFRKVVDGILKASIKRTVSIEGLYNNSQATAKLRNSSYAYLFIDAAYAQDKKRHYLRFTRS